jgi:DNA (cytosine-5)-methyltransferase 1
MNELHLFAGAGGGILAGQMLGHRCVCAVEWDPYAQAVLVARQNDGTFPPFPIWDDVQTFDGRPFRGHVDVVAGGFPCQDISVAGGGTGLDGKRSGMWHHMARIIGEVRPRFAYIENSPALVTRGLDRVLSDLAALGFDARWGVLGASDVGAPHKRERIWILANAQRIGQPAGRDYHGQHERPQLGAAGQHTGEVANPDCERQERPRCRAEQKGRAESSHCGTHVAHPGSHSRQGQQQGSPNAQERAQPGERQARPRDLCVERWPVEPGLGRVAHGVAHRAHRIKAIGNGQVPRVAATAFNLLSKTL